jgi:hypothetical protein
MKTCGGVTVLIHVLLISALVADELSDSRSGRFTPDIHWIGSWVAPKAGLDDVKKRKLLTSPGL